MWNKIGGVQKEEREYKTVYIAKTDNINVVNDSFENSIPSVILLGARY